eukprot:gene7867-biopygen11837
MPWGIQCWEGKEPSKKKGARILTRSVLQLATSGSQPIISALPLCLITRPPGNSNNRDDDNEHDDRNNSNGGDLLERPVLPGTAAPEHPAHGAAAGHPLRHRKFSGRQGCRGRVAAHRDGAPRGGDGMLRAPPRPVPHEVGAVAGDGADDPVQAGLVDDDLEHPLEHRAGGERRGLPEHLVEGAEVRRDDGDHPAQRPVLLANPPRGLRRQLLPQQGGLRGGLRGDVFGGRVGPMGRGGACGAVGLRTHARRTRRHSPQIMRRGPRRGPLPRMTGPPGGREDLQRRQGPPQAAIAGRQGPRGPPLKDAC